MKNILFIAAVFFGCYIIKNKVADRKRQIVYATIWSAFIWFLCLRMLVNTLAIA